MYIPKERDIVSVSFDPAKGHEIQKKEGQLLLLVMKNLIV